MTFRTECRRHLCCFCQCDTWQQKFHGSFAALGWECGECGGLLAFYHDEPLAVAERRRWEAFARGPRGRWI